MRRAACVIALLTLSAVLVSPAVAADGRSASPAVTTPGDSPEQARLSAPANATVVVDVHGNRSARWTVSLTYGLDTENESATFERYAEAYRNFETDAGPTVAPYRRIVDAAATTTGRSMAVRDVTRTARVGESTGSVSLSFTWTNMLERTGNRTIRLGDALSLTADRTWLDSLEANQTLVVRTPPGYSVVNTEAPSFNLENNSVIVSGPIDLEGALQITYRETGGTGEEGDPTPWGMVAGAVVVGAVVVAGVLYRRLREPTPSTDDDDPSPEPAETADPPPDPPGDGAAAVPGGGGGTEAELLSDEERIERLLRSNEGRMKQANIVRETGWSDAKVSQLLSAMDDEGRVTKLRLGRENLISLPDETD